MASKKEISSHRFKEKCNVCGNWSNQYVGHKGMIVCKDCMEKTGGEIELDEPIQTTVFDFLEV